MNRIKIQPTINSLDIDYQRGQSLTLSVNAAERLKQQRFWLWSIVLILTVVALALAFQFTSLLVFDTKGILWLIGFVLVTGFSVFRIIQNYSKTPYTFQKINFLFDKIEIYKKSTPRIVTIPKDFEYTLRLNQAAKRPQITMLLNDQTIRFQLDNMQDFPIVTDAIADVLKSTFKTHKAINDDVEELVFEPKP